MRQVQYVISNGVHALITVPLNIDIKMFFDKCIFLPSLLAFFNHLRPLYSLTSLLIYSTTSFTIYKLIWPLLYFCLLCCQVVTKVQLVVYRFQESWDEQTSWLACSSFYPFCRTTSKFAFYYKILLFNIFETTIITKYNLLYNRLCSFFNNCNSKTISIILLNQPCMNSKLVLLGEH